MALGKKKKYSGYTISQLQEELDGIKDSNRQMRKKRSSFVFCLQSIAFLALAIAIPEAVVHNQMIFAIFTGIGAVALLIPFLYTSNECAYWDQRKFLEKMIEEKGSEDAKNEEENTKAAKETEGTNDANEAAEE